MGAAREGFNLFNPWGRKHIVKHIKAGNWRHVNHYFWGDSFGFIVCAFVGHDEFKTSIDFEPDEFGCKRCGKFIKNPS